MKNRKITALYEGLSRDDKQQREVKSSRKIQFSKGIVRCIIKAAKEGDIFEYNRADTSRDLERLKSLRYMDNDFKDYKKCSVML